MINPKHHGIIVLKPFPAPPLEKGSLRRHPYDSYYRRHGVYRTAYGPAVSGCGEDVVITRYRTWREPDFLKDRYGKRVQIESIDTTSHQDILGAALKHKPTGIVHLPVPALAALPPAEDYRVNTDSLINVLEAGRIAGVKRVRVASSVAVYSTGLKEGPFRGDMYVPLWSSNPTETWKRAEEIMGQHHADRSGMEIVFMRSGRRYRGADRAPGRERARLEAQQLPGHHADH
jgi:nucleoside-diphosphate-sugar epimerase